MSEVIPAPKDPGLGHLPCVHFTLGAKPRRPLKPPRHGDLLKALTLNIVEKFSKCSSEFAYSESNAPRRWLTKPWKGCKNSGWDNQDYDYICSVGDKIVNPDGHAYEIVEALGQGTFGQVLKCNTPGGPSVALKIIKSKPEYYQQALSEVAMLKILNEEHDPADEAHIVRMCDYFVYRKHLCIAFELLIGNLFDVLRQNNFEPFPLLLIQELTRQLLCSLNCLANANIIHCDLKPENVLLSSTKHPIKVKLCDLGSACFSNAQVSSYIQSRFYRSPEVLLGMRYTSAIDMWSLGCICGELFLGLPIFPGVSQFDQIRQIIRVLGNFPMQMLRAGKHTRKYFCREEASLSTTASPLRDALNAALVDQPALVGVSHPAAVDKLSRRPRTASLGRFGANQDLSGDDPEVLRAKSAGCATSVSWTTVSTSSAMGSQAGSVAAKSDAEVVHVDAQDVATKDSAETSPPPAVESSSPATDPWQGNWRLKTMEEYAQAESRRDRTPRQRPRDFSSLRGLIDLVEVYLLKQPDERARKQEIARRESFLQFLEGILQLIPEDRLTPKQAMQHPFILGTSSSLPQSDPTPQKDFSSAPGAAPPQSSAVRAQAPQAAQAPRQQAFYSMGPWSCVPPYPPMRVDTIAQPECYRPDIRVPTFSGCWVPPIGPTLLHRWDVPRTEWSARSAPGGAAASGNGPWSDTGASCADSAGSTPSKIKSRARHGGGYNWQGRQIPVHRGGGYGTRQNRKANKGPVRNSTSTTTTPVSTPHAGPSMASSGTPGTGAHWDGRLSGGNGGGSTHMAGASSQDERPKASSPWHLSSRLSVNSGASSVASGSESCNSQWKLNSERGPSC